MNRCPVRGGGERATIAAMSGTARMIVWLVAMSAAFALGVGALTSRGEWDTLAIQALVTWFYSLAIGLPIGLIMRRLKPRLYGRGQLGQWAVYAGVVFGSMIAGTFVVRGGLVLAGGMTVEEMWSGMLLSLEISVAIALPMSVGAATYSRLQGRVTASERQASEARLASLESRIRPHFLFNALNSAAALIPTEPRRAEDVLVRLGALLRSSLDTRARLVPLADELRVVVDYLEIERSRFGERLAYDVEVAEGAGEVAVPPFAVQTLVENSVKHAVAARAEGARIAIRARMDGGALVVAVTDDGPGFRGTPWVAGHGLDSLRERLATLYGAGATLAVGAGAGAAVTMTVREAAP
jgi:hypothetical protein